MSTLKLKTLHCRKIVVGGSEVDPFIPPTVEYATVTFVPGGGMDDMDIQVEIGTAITEIPAPTREGWEFQGWWSAEVGGVELDSSQPVQESATYYAHWVELEEEETRYATITINGNGSISGPREEHYRIGDRVTSFNYTMTRYGYARDGLWTEPEGGIRVDNQIEGYEITGDETWYYHWRPAQFTITFVYNRGMTGSEQKQITYLSQLGNLPEPTANGYTLDGWFTTSTGGDQISSSTQVTGNATYYGHWTLIENPITYNMNGHGSVPEDALLVNSVEKMEDYTPPNPDPVEGWTFAGWNPASIAMENYSAVTFTAQWVENGTGEPEEPESHIDDPEIQEEFANIDEEIPIDSNFSLDGFLDEPDDEGEEEEEEVPPVEHEDDPEDVDIEDFGHVDENSTIGQDRQTEEDMKLDLFNIIQLMQRG